MYCSVGLKDDRTETFLNAIKSRMRDNTQIVSSIIISCVIFILSVVKVICILPSNRKDRYDAIKKYCCVECPGMSYLVCVCVCVCVCACR